MPNRIIIEICVDSIESAVAAGSGGADRIELCGSLSDGGITPSAGLIATVRSKVSLAVFVMIRPRTGDFLYSADEFRAMERDVVMAKQLGAQGVVFGILTDDGRVDVDRTQRLVEIARPLQVTFHRAYDLSRDLNESLEDLVRAGVDRLLTSGGEETAELGKATVARINEQAGDRMIVMAGAGIKENNAQQLIKETGIREIHASLRTAVASPMQYHNRKISFTGVKGRDYQRLIVLEEMVRRLRAAAESAVAH